MPLQEYSTNLERIISKFQAAGVSHILLLCPPPVFDEGRIRQQQERMGNYEVTPAPDRTLNATGLYAEACRNVAAAKNLPSVDLFTKLQVGLVAAVVQGPGSCRQQAAVIFWN